MCEPLAVTGSIYDPWTPKADMIDNFKSLCDSHSNQASYKSIGKSQLGNDIWMFRFGNPDGGVVLWDGQMHGEEDYGTEILWLMAQWLFSGDPRATNILQTNYVLMVPIVNIDVWGRYNARGVNLNRNFATGWSANAEKPGSSPFSENETKVMRNVFQEYKPNFYVNLHQGASRSYFAYFSESDRNLADQVTSRAERIAGDLGVDSYSVSRMRSTGFAIGDAFYLGGSSSWLVEVDPGWVHTEENWQRLVNTMYPKCLAMFIAMCETSAIEFDPTLNPPIILEYLPNIDTVNVPITTNVEVSFNEPMSRSYTQSAFSLDSVSGSFSWNPASTVLTFTPDSDLTYDTLYTVILTTEALDQQGENMLTEYSWSFTTAPITPPTVVSIIPFADATNVAINSAVEVTFSESMDMATTAGAFSLDGVTGSSRWSNSWSSPNSILTFTPDSPLDYDKVYRATISTVAQDQQGENMATQYSWSFTTYAPPPPKPTSISIFLINSTIVIGSEIEISGNLTSDNGGISKATILVSYSTTNGETWIDINNTLTRFEGHYSTLWKPPSIGSYLVKALWSGDSSFLETSEIALVLVNPIQVHENFSVISNSQISELVFNPENYEILFTTSGLTETPIFCNVTIPKDMLTGNPWMVQLDNQNLSYISYENSTHSSICFTYPTSGIFQVQINGTGIMPVVPIVIILSVFMLAAILGVIYWKKRLRSTKI